MTVSISDMTVPPQKPEMIQKAQDTVDRITKNYKRGLITEEERYKEVVETWKATDDALTEALLTGLDKYNNIYMMADSGARGSDKQIKQLAGMRGLMADTTGRTIELPIKSNFREGLDVLEYFPRSQKRTFRYRPSYRRLWLPDQTSGRRIPGADHP